jgi:uncharacterized membrane protein
MPYHWTSPDRVELRPYRSLPRRGFAIVIGLFFCLIMLPMVATIGTLALWGLLPFGLIALAALWRGLEQSYRDGDILEVLDIAGDEVRLTRRDPDGSVQDWRCNPYWVRVTKHLRGGPVPHYVTLNGNGREVEIGAFLAEDERQSLFGELSAALPRR